MLVPDHCLSFPDFYALFTVQFVSDLISTPGPVVINNSCLTQRSMNFFLLINVKMLIIFGILTLCSGKTSI